MSFKSTLLLSLLLSSLCSLSMTRELETQNTLGLFKGHQKFNRNAAKPLQLDSTVTNADGSVTTTTDNDDGSVTTTTTEPDGSSSSTTTYPSTSYSYSTDDSDDDDDLDAYYDCDESSGDCTLVTNEDGSVTTTTDNDDGSVTVVNYALDGTVTTTITDADGSTYTTTAYSSEYDVDDDSEYYYSSDSESLDDYYDCDSSDCVLVQNNNGSITTTTYNDDGSTTVVLYDTDGYIYTTITEADGSSYTYSAYNAAFDTSSSSYAYYGGTSSSSTSSYTTAPSTSTTTSSTSSSSYTTSPGTTTSSSSYTTSPSTSNSSAYTTSPGINSTSGYTSAGNGTVGNATSNSSTSVSTSSDAGSYVGTGTAVSTSSSSNVVVGTGSSSALNVSSSSTYSTAGLQTSTETTTDTTVDADSDITVDSSKSKTVQQTTAENDTWWGQLVALFDDLGKDLNSLPLWVPQSLIVFLIFWICYRCYNIRRKRLLAKEKLEHQEYEEGKRGERILNKAKKIAKSTESKQINKIREELAASDDKQRRKYKGNKVVELIEMYEDQDIWMKDSANTHLSYQKLQHEIITQQPHIQNHESKRFRRFSICGTNVGNHCCCRRKSDSSIHIQTDSEIEKVVGLQCSLYFKMMKQISYVFFLLSLIILPLLFIYDAGNVITTKSQNFQDNIFRYTIGNLGESDDYCGSATFDTTQKIELSCSTADPDSIYTIMNLVEYGLSVLDGETNCPTGMVQQYNLDLIDTCTYENLDETARSNALDSFYDKCVGEAVCNFPLSDFNLNSQHCNSKSGEFYVVYQCQNPDPLECSSSGCAFLTRNYIANVAVFLDCIIVVIFFINISWLRVQEEFSESLFNDTEIQVEDFGIWVKNLPPQKDQHSLLKLKIDLIEFMTDIVKNTDQVTDPEKIQKEIHDIDQHNGNHNTSRVLNSQGDQKKYVVNDPSEIVSVTFGLNNYDHLEIIQSIHDELESIKELEHMEQHDEHHKDSFRIMFSEKCDDIAYLVDEYNHFMNNRENLYAKNAFILFRTQEGCERAKKALIKSRKQRICAYLFKGVREKQKQKNIYKPFQGRELIVKPAQAPEQYVWENFGVSKDARIFRKFLQLIIFGLLGVIALYSMSLFEITNNEIGDMAQTQDCTDVDVSYSDAEADYNLDSTDRNGDYSCFCQAEYDEGKIFITSYTATGSETNDQYDKEQTLCADWLEAQTFSNLMQYGMSLIISLCNSLIALAVDFLASFNRTQLKAEQSKDQMIMTAWLTYINTIAILMVANLNFGEILNEKNFWDNLSFMNVPLFNGSISNFGIDFYNNVAVTIGVAMLFEIMIPLALTVFSIFSFKFDQWKDRGFTSDRANTKQIKQSQYEALYLGQEFSLEERYANMLNWIWVAMTLSPAVPMIIPITFVNFFVNYWIDKYLLFRINRSPKALDKTLSTCVIDSMWWGAVFHALAGYYIYSEITIFPISQDYYQYYLSHTLLNEWFNIQRMASQHMSWFFFFNLIAICTVYLHTPLAYVIRRMFCFGKIKDLRENGTTYSDDFYRECSYLQLYYEWLRMCEEEHQIIRAENSKKPWRHIDPEYTQLYKNKLREKKATIQGLCTEYFRIMDIKGGNFEQKMVKLFSVNDKLSVLRKTNGPALGIAERMNGFWQSFDIADSQQYMDIIELEHLLKTGKKEQSKRQHMPMDKFKEALSHFGLVSGKRREGDQVKMLQASENISPMGKKIGEAIIKKLGIANMVRAIKEEKARQVQEPMIAKQTETLQVQQNQQLQLNVFQDNMSMNSQNVHRRRYKRRDNSDSSRGQQITQQDFNTRSTMQYNDNNPLLQSQQQINPDLMRSSLQQIDERTVNRSTSKQTFVQKKTWQI